MNLETSLSELVVRISLILIAKKWALRGCNFLCPNVDPSFWLDELPPKSAFFSDLIREGSRAISSQVAGYILEA